MDDAVDRLVAEWRATEPDLDLEPVTVVNRILRLAPLFERALAETVGRHGLTLPEFSLLSVLRRQGAPYRIPQRELPDRLLLTPATVSIRLDALEESGLVHRVAAASGRAQDVVLTAEGRKKMDAVVADHLDTERQLIAALDGSATASLGSLLRRLTMEHDGPGALVSPAGCTIEGTVRTGERFAQLGHTAPRGLLIGEVVPGSPAELAGLRVGDVIEGLDGRPVLGLADIAPLAADRSTGVCCAIRQGDTDREISLTW